MAQANIPVPAAPDAPAGEHAHGHAALAPLTIGAIGVVYGDIGTSPLYALREAFGHAGGLTPDEVSILGVLSLMFWSLLLIVAVKYIMLILRADNRGEGGVLALSALAQRGAGERQRARLLVFALSIMGLALFYGDALITPAISVLSAVEGLAARSKAFEAWAQPIAVTVLIGLFVIQRFGTGRVGSLFGPIMVLWFSVLAVLGLMEIAHQPSILRALDPRYAVALFAHDGWQAFVALGAIVLCITGGEALYADMGHFGRTPIRIAWYGLVLPALVLNYFGQGALILRDPATIEHPFFLLAPDWALYPMVGLATAATIIASQAVISGVFSLTRQAIQLGYLPRMTIRHTSHTSIGQIYIPKINWVLMAGVVFLVVMFGSSSDLAAAYGISVTAAMSIDAILAGCVAAWLWGWSAGLAVAVFGSLLMIDLAYVASNSLKIPEGGWLPLVVAAVVIYFVRTWRRGRMILRQRLYANALPVTSFLDKIGRVGQRVTGTAIFMTTSVEVVPASLLHNLKHNHVLHERVVLMKVTTADVPTVAPREVVEVEKLGKGFYTVVARFGFMDEPNVPRALEACRAFGLAFDPMTTSFFLAHETLIPSSRPEMGQIEERLFILLAMTATSPAQYFQLPPDRVVELGTQIEI